MKYTKSLKYNAMRIKFSYTDSRVSHLEVSLIIPENRNNFTYNKRIPDKKEKNETGTINIH